MKRRKPAGSTKDAKVADYRHKGSERTNIPPAKLAGEGVIPQVAKAHYYYSPHLAPGLRFDPTGSADRIQALVQEAIHRPLRADEALVVAEATQQYQPWLEWAGKREEHDRRSFDVDPVALHIHERVSAQAIVRTALRKDVQKDLFADPQQPYSEAVQFYRHSMDWANRLILGDSLQVMSSLARREGIIGKVQMVYIDPPYGVRFGSNFQGSIGKREVKDKDADLSREAETIRAYRDTWTLGVHSYLTYLRARFIVARELLAETGSVFVQISDDNLHSVRAVLDEVFGAENFLGLITVQKTTGVEANFLPSVADYLLWYARDVERATYSQLYIAKDSEDSGADRYDQVRLVTGEQRPVSPAERAGQPLPAGAVRFQLDNLSASEFRPATSVPFEFSGRTFTPGPNNHWKTTVQGLRRLAGCERVAIASTTLRYVRLLEDFAVKPVANLWTDISGSVQSRSDPKVFAVQTSSNVVARCMLMTTRPGDLVVDPTCGSGTTAFVAEQWGRRWITIDTSRVSLAIARQRLMTASYEAFATEDGSSDPRGGLKCRKIPRVTLKSIAQNQNLDPILAAYDGPLAKALADVNAALQEVSPAERKVLRLKHQEKVSREGAKAVTEAERRRWLLPDSAFDSGTVPFEADTEWPSRLQSALAAYRRTWREKMDAVEACIASNCETVELVDQPEVVRGVVRVAGPFTVEGVRPEELSLGDEGLFDATPNQVDDGSITKGDAQNYRAYLTRMVQHLRGDGLTHINNRRQRFERLEELFEQSTGSFVHAEGLFEGADLGEPNNVAVTFGPQYGPVTAQHVEEAIRGSRRYSDLVVAGFAFDAEASAVIQESAHPKLRVHQAYIRPDINPGMEGLLKDTPNSQLFTVFGQPEVEVGRAEPGEWVCRLKGVDIYDPVANTIQSTGADKVAAWFLDSDYDGRCFCITQAFFPDQDAWGRIAKALGSHADIETFSSFKGTESLQFPTGKHKRIAVKVIDPRGNEVMAIRKLEA